jgi:hypothetical protein
MRRLRIALRTSAAAVLALGVVLWLYARAHPRGATFRSRADDRASTASSSEAISMPSVSRSMAHEGRTSADPLCRASIPCEEPATAFAPEALAQRQRAPFAEDQFLGRPRTAPIITAGTAPEPPRAPVEAERPAPDDPSDFVPP